MSETLLNTPDDLQWLWDTHLKNFKATTRADFNVKAATIHGNEDCPDQIKLYTKADPMTHTKPVATFELQADLSYQETRRLKTAT